MVSLKKLKDSQEELNTAKGATGSFHESLHFTRGAIRQLKGKVSTSDSKLKEAHGRVWEAENKASRL